MELDKIINGDCLQIMRDIPTASVDMILCDLPYGTTRNKWDSVIPLDKLWEQYLRIIKPNGAIVLTAVQIFASQLILSNVKYYKYDWIWEKTISSGQLNVNKQPLRRHENVLVFYKKQPVYNQQFTKGKPYSINRKVTFKGESYNQQTDSQKTNNGYRHPTSIINVANPRIKNGHPTQKPVALFEYLIKTYTNKNDVILDNCIGAGTTGIAAINTGRHFIGIELSTAYCKMANDNIEKAKNERL
jgi:site-specific DNA-methyltransferase (adenine-specific)